MISLGKGGGQRQINDIKVNPIRKTTFRYSVRDNLKGEPQITQEHIKSNPTVRSALKRSNIYLENLPPAEDIKKIDRKIKSENKKLPKATKVLSEE